MFKKKKKPPVHNIQHLCDMAHIADRDASTDVLGSYTGVPWDDEWDVPVQDADDL